MQNVDVLLAQSEEDARRLVLIGAPADRVHVGGNLKFEVKPPEKPEILDPFAAAVKREEIGPVLVAGSTLEGEEAMLLDCFRQIVARYPNALMVLAPRHPQRFESVAGLMAASGLGWQRRSEWDGQRGLAGGVFLLDSIGELANFYEFADLAFVGGSLVPKGGHNVLEAAQFGTAILVGPYTDNFRDVVSVFQRADALRVVTPGSLTSTVLELLQNDSERAGLGQRAREVMAQQQGATERTITALLQLLPAQQNSSPAAVVAERHA
jgi:3-deoxy-D-manno-octulosonic-acid transferase